MEVYIVTTGCYSDYGIDKVFLDKEKAEHYAEWREDARVEVYSTEEEENTEEMWKIRISGRFVPNKKITTPICNVEKTNKEDEFNRTYFTDYRKYNTDYCELTIIRCIPNKNFDENFYVNRYTKAYYDFCYMISQKLNEGFTEKDICELLENKDFE